MRKAPTSKHWGAVGYNEYSSLTVQKLILRIKEGSPISHLSGVVLEVPEVFTPAPNIKS